MSGFVPWPAPVLRSPAAPVGEVTEEHRDIWDRMVEAMEAMPGVGLAAPQIGIGLRLAVVDASEGRGRAVRLADPEIVRTWEGEATHWEGSPNVRGRDGRMLGAEVTRPARIEVAFTDERNRRLSKGFDGIWAASVQHQIDHLDGRMFFDRLSRTRRHMLLRKARR
ncbi:peptide deformylase [Hasllibacter halocynthiae]|uniref:Peptide deformylase-like n=1 Tax=Hasllibacter halocynthiae TaxID=595589 RepID=A0A2T0X3B6_9RHOB|nr:peptide deformylase [Hasllibacter halocynthiae]PRY93407.1 peptide deformylase [Hasllibacter halocynthiae]